MIEVLLALDNLCKLDKRYHYRIKHHVKNSLFEMYDILLYLSLRGDSYIGISSSASYYEEDYTCVNVGTRTGVVSVRKDRLLEYLVDIIKTEFND